MSSATQEFRRKIARKFSLRRYVGELYVGKRMKQHALRRVLPSLSPPAGSRVLEVGCEDGCFTEWLDRCWPQATVEGLDRDEPHVDACAAWAAAHGRTPKLTFRQGNILELTEANTYELIFCLDVLGYILDDTSAIDRLFRALKPGGRLIVHQPNVRYRCFGGRVHDVSPEEAGKVTPGHVRHGYSPAGLEKLLTTRGFKVEQLEQWQGQFADLAHRIYRLLERPTVARFLALPFIDLLWWIDTFYPGPQGNTVFAIARKGAPLGQ